MNRHVRSHLPSDIHPKWCPCLECATEWDAAHPEWGLSRAGRGSLRRYAATLASLMIGTAAIVAIALFIGVPA